jgi:hypothetical protein
MLWTDNGVRPTSLATGRLTLEGGATSAFTRGIAHWRRKASFSYLRWWVGQFFPWPFPAGTAEAQECQHAPRCRSP